MILGIGVDIVDVRRIRAAHRRFGQRLARRILHKEEMPGYLAAGSRAEYYLAKRWAAKEALAKALGTGFRGDFTMLSVRISHSAEGQPRIHCQGRAGRQLEEQGAVAHVSLSDERHYSCGFVVIEKV